MGNRSRAREVTLQLLFQRDFNPAVDRGDIQRFVLGRVRNPAVAPFCLSLYDGVVAHLGEIDELLTAVADNWRLPRMPVVDRNVLRLGSFELRFMPEIPATVALDEAITLARRFGSAASPAFVNGVLDRISKQQQEIRKADVLPAASVPAAPGRADARAAAVIMPTRQPFTALCQSLNQPRSSGRADLHVHSTCSDGKYTPAQVVELAARSGLAAVAITDHDTVAAIAPARMAALGTQVEMVPGVEISTEFDGRDLHLFGYFIDVSDGALLGALDRLKRQRLERFWVMAQQLRHSGVSLDEQELHALTSAGTVGRRHLAELLVKARRASSVREAFVRYLGDRGKIAVPKVRLPVAEAIERVRAAGGVTSWAHPASDCTRDTLARLRDQGLHAVEAGYPGFRPSRSRALHGWAAESAWQ